MTQPKEGNFPIVLGKSRLFPHLFPFFTLFDAIRIAVQYTVHGKSVAKEGDYGTAAANQFPLQVRHPTGGLISAALGRSQQIGGFHLDVEPRTPNTELGSSRIETTGFQQIITNTISPVFTNYFENYRPWLDDKLGSDPYQWTGTLNFSRVVRNAASHGGVLFWQKPTAPPVSWYGLKYSSAEQGRCVLGGDLVLGDLLILMLEIDRELDQLGCPI